MRISFYFHFILLEIMNKCIIWRWFGAVQYDCCIDCIAGSCNVVGYNKEAVHCPQHPSSRNNIHNARLLHPTVKRMRTLQHCTQAYKLQLKAFILYIYTCMILGHWVPRSYVHQLVKARRCVVPPLSVSCPVAQLKSSPPVRERRGLVSHQEHTFRSGSMWTAPAPPWRSGWCIALAPSST